jgi:hypothetical protein
MVRLPFSLADECMFVQSAGKSPFTLEFIDRFMPVSCFG